MTTSPNTMIIARFRVTMSNNVMCSIMSCTQKQKERMRRRRTKIPQLIPRMKKRLLTRNRRRSSLRNPRQKRVEIRGTTLRFLRSGMLGERSNNRITRLQQITSLKL